MEPPPPPPPVAASVSTAGPRVDVSATTIDHLDRVTVTVTAAAPGDWLGVYCLEQDGVDEILDATDFLDYRATSGADKEMLDFGPLVNMRCAVLQFQLRSRDNALVARASGVQFRKGPAEPTQRHLAVTALPTEMRVAWTSANVSAHAPRVRYGRSAHALDREAVASGVTYDADDMCTAPATTRSPRLFRHPGVIYDATMTDLTPGETYYYQVGSGAVSGVHWSDVRSFRVPPLEGDDRAVPPMSFFVFGDLMAPTDATRDFHVRGSCGTTMELIERDLIRDDEHQYAALIHVGDLSYAAGRTYVWDHFGALIEPVASRLPYMVSLGNHDFGYLEGREGRKPLRAPQHQVFDKDETKGFDAHGECGVPTEARFRMPATGNGMLWYSFDMGLTHHTVLSGEHDFSKGSPMHTWLLQDLASVDRTQTPWLIVHLHRPLYCSVAFRGDFVRSLFLRDELERVFAVFRVDIVFSGHYHSYERTCPVYDDQCQYGPRGEARAPVHIMVGSGGANVDTYGHYQYGIHWSEAAKLSYGYGRLHVFNASHAQFEFVENDARDVTDAMWIVTDHNWSVHDKWRWRRVVLHPTVWFLVTTAAVMVSLIIMAVRRHRQRHVGFGGGLRRHIDKLR